MQLASIWVRRKPALGVVVAVLLQACYAPDPQSGAPCEDDTRCPIGQRCVVGFCRYATAELVDAAPDPRDAGAISCQSAETCTTATMLGTVSGDTSQQSLTARGNRAAWLRVRVTENDSDFTGVPLRVLAKVTSPPGAAFDVRLYVNVNDDVIECATVVGTSTSSGNVRAAHAFWGEDTVPDGADNSRNVAIEIRPLASACASDASWELSVGGNVN